MWNRIESVKFSLEIEFGEIDVMGEIFFVECYTLLFYKYILQCLQYINIVILLNKVFKF